MAAGLQDCRTAGKAGQLDSKTTGQKDIRTAGQQDSRTAQQQDIRTVGQQDSRAQGQQDSRTAGEQNYLCYPFVSRSDFLWFQIVWENCFRNDVGNVCLVCMDGSNVFLDPRI